MAGYARPDVYITEQLAQTSPSFFPSVTPAAFIGYCVQGPLEPTLIDSWPTFVRLFGGWTNTVNDALAVQVYQYFSNGGRIAYVVRALGIGSASAVLTVQDRQSTPATLFTVTASNPGAWGNNVFVEIVDTGVTGRFNLNVRVGTATNAPIERFVDLSMNPADSRNAVQMINTLTTGSNYIDLAVAGNWVYAPATSVPVATTPIGSGGTALSGGADSSSPPTSGASGQLITALNTLSVVSAGLIINMVGVTDATTLNAAIAYVSARGDSFMVIDPLVGQNSTSIVTYKQTLTQSSYAAVYWPNVYIGDPSSITPGATKLVPPSGSVMGQIALTDATRGTSKAPAGVSTSLAGVLALEVPKPTSVDYDVVASGHVNGIRYFPQFGYVIWGSGTLKSTQADSQISIRRTLIAIEQAIQQATLFAVQEVNDSDLWATITASVTSILQQLYQQGGLRGLNPSDAYFVTCDNSNNTPQTIAAGEVHVTVGVALQYPALFIVINVGQFSGSSAVLETLV